jgi:WD40 repeat protein
MLAVSFTDADTNHGFIQVWDIVNLEMLTEVDAHNGAITGLVWSPDGMVIVSASRDGTVGIWGIKE